MKPLFLFPSARHNQQRSFRRSIFFILKAAQIADKVLSPAQGSTRGRSPSSPCKEVILIDLTAQLLRLFFPLSSVKRGRRRLATADIPISAAPFGCAVRKNKKAPKSQVMGRKLGCLKALVVGRGQGRVVRGATSVISGRPGLDTDPQAAAVSKPP